MYVFGEEKNARALIKNSFTTKKKKNATHPLSLQQIIVATPRITGHGSYDKYNTNEKV